MLYNENKVKQQKAKLIMASRFGTEIDRLDNAAKLKRFELLTFQKPNVKTNALHIMLNFDSSDKLDNGKLQNIASDYMEQIGFGEQPYLVYQHFDTAHPHLHVVTTNINAEGERMDIHGIGRTLSEQARKELETKYELVKAEGSNKSEALEINAIDLPRALYGKSATKRTITNVVWTVLRSYKFTSLAEYNAILGTFGVIADRGKDDTQMFEHKGLVYSLIDVDQQRVGIPFKASHLSGRPVLKEVEKKFERSREIRKTYKDSITRRVDWVLGGYDGITKHTFDKLLAAQKIGVVYRTNAQGLIYGVTFVDHRTKCVFNGSDLGKAYSAKALTDRFTGNDEKKSFLRTAITSEQSPGQPNEISKDRNADKGFLDMLLAPSRNDLPPGGVVPRKRKKRSRSNSQDLSR